MTPECDAVLEAEQLTATQRAHVETCASCRSTLEVLELAKLPEPTALELDALAASRTKTLRASRKSAITPLPRRSMVWHVTQLALAAGLGALVTSAILSKPASSRVADPQVTVRPVVLEVPALPEPSLDEANLSDVEVFFEVSWPSTSATEGEL